MSKVAEINNYLNQVMAERQELIETCLAAVASKSHVFLLGPPGGGKTMIVTELGKIFSGKTFALLFSKQTKLEEIFGPFRITALKEDKFIRNTDNTVVDCDLFIADEIWKAGGHNLNPLLTILNERQFDNGGQRIDCALKSAFLCSNELPEDASLEALYDRCLFRTEVNYVGSKESFNDIVFSEKKEIERPSISLHEFIKEFEDAEKNISVEKIQDTFFRFILQLREKGSKVSDRRAKAIVRGLKALAWVRGYNEVTANDYIDAVDMIWSDPGEKPTIVQIASEYADPGVGFLRNINRDLQVLENRLKTATKETEIKSIMNDSIELANKVEIHSEINQESKMQYRKKFSDFGVAAARKAIFT